MATIAEEILEFSESRPEWQQDLMRRIATQIELSDADLDEVVQMLKSEHGLIAKENAPIPEPLTKKHLPHDSPKSLPVIINSISDLKHVNRLAESQSLSFADKGLTLVYADNACGKSGYCRVLKKLCRVRKGAEEVIYGNVFEEVDCPPASGNVRYKVGVEDVQSVGWRDDGDSPDELSRISVFDIKTVPIYANQSNVIEFLPRGLDILTRLAQVSSDNIAVRIEHDKINIRLKIDSPLPSFPDGTKIGELVKTIIPDTDSSSLPPVSVIVKLAVWSEADKVKLADAEKQLAMDPNILAERCMRTGAALNRLVEDIAKGDEVLSDVLIKEYKTVLASFTAAKKTSELTSKELFSDEPLDGVGADPWRKMFEYAREYSSMAYPDGEFPVVGPGSRCLFCQQPLNGEASDRIVRFAGFMQGAAQTELKKCEAAANESKSAIEACSIKTPGEVGAMLGELSGLDPESDNVIAKVSSYCEGLQERKSSLLQSFQNPGIPVHAAKLSKTPGEGLLSAGKRLDKMIESFEKKDGDAERRSKLMANINELKAQEILANNQEAIVARLEDLKIFNKLRVCEGVCDTVDISRKGSELRKKHITQDFEERLKNEFEHFDLLGLPYQIEQRSERGEHYIGVGLKTSKQIRNEQILSTGEFNAVAAACFLAEIGGIQGHNGIIFDDPVTSMDHIWASKFAKRLVEEAEGGRQVVVFTHNLPFYYETWLAAAKKQVPLKRHWLKKEKGIGCGVVHEDDGPWEAKPVKDRIKDLDKKYESINAIQDKQGVEYLAAVEVFYADMRETWERLVEQELLYDVVNRFEVGIQTLRLRSVEVSDEDYHKIFYAMKKSSEYSGHDRAKGMQKSYPAIQEIGEDLQQLKDFKKDIGSRRADTQKRRKQITKPPAGVTS